MAEQIIGKQQLEARLRALASPELGEKVLTRLGLSTVREAKLLVRRRTGNLGRSIHIASKSATSVVVVASASYAADVEFGTRPHTITPKAKKALRFAASPGGARLSGTPRKGAAVVFAKVVHHPGTRPYPFLLPGAKAAAKSSDLDVAVVETWNSGA